MRLFRKSSSGSASVILAFASLISYVAGLGRDLLLSFFFGAAAVTDAYNTSFLIPDMIYTLTTAGALSGIFLPVFRNIDLKDKEEAAYLAGSFLILGQLLVLTLSIPAFIFMPQLIEIFFKNITGDQAALITNMSRILLLSPIIFSISNTFGSILITFKHYLAYAFSAAFYNVGIILGLVLFHDELGIYSAVAGVVAGLILHFGLRLINFRSLDFKIRFAWFRPGIAKIIKLALPKTVGMLVFQLSLWAYNIIGYTLVTGSIAAFFYARNIQSFAVSLFGIAVATAVFPYIVDFKETRQKNELIQKIESTAIQILTFALPSAVGLALLDSEVVAALLGRGAFDSHDIFLTASVLFFFAFSIPLESLMHLFTRVYYAFHNTVIPVSINILFLAINLSGSFYFAQTYGAKTFSFFFALASFVQVTLLISFLKKYVRLHFKFLSVKLLKIITATIIMSGFVLFVRDGLSLGLWPRLILGVLSGVISYFIVLYFTDMLRYTGIDRIKRSLTTVFKK